MDSDDETMSNDYHPIPSNYYVDNPNLLNVCPPMYYCDYIQAFATTHLAQWLHRIDPSQADEGYFYMSMVALLWQNSIKYDVVVAKDQKRRVFVPERHDSDADCAKAVGWNLGSQLPAVQKFGFSACRRFAANMLSLYAIMYDSGYPLNSPTALYMSKELYEAFGCTEKQDVFSVIFMHVIKYYDHDALLSLGRQFGAHPNLSIIPEITELHKSGIKRAVISASLRNLKMELVHEGVTTDVLETPTLVSVAHAPGEKFNTVGFGESKVIYDDGMIRFKIETLESTVLETSEDPNISPFEWIPKEARRAKWKSRLIKRQIDARLKVYHNHSLLGMYDYVTRKFYKWKDYEQVLAHQQRLVHKSLCFFDPFYNEGFLRGID